MSKNTLKLAQDVTEKYIERYGAHFCNIDELDTMIAETIETASAEAWGIIDEFSFILFLNKLHEDSKFSQIYEKAINWLTKYENSEE